MIKKSVLLDGRRISFDMNDVEFYAEAEAILDSGNPAVIDMSDEFKFLDSAEESEALARDRIQELKAKIAVHRAEHMERVERINDLRESDIDDSYDRAMREIEPLEMEKNQLIKALVNIDCMRIKPMIIPIDKADVLK